MMPTWKENPTFAVLLSIVAIALTVFIGVKAWNGVAEHDQIGRAVRDRDVITIDGEGKVTSKPTLAKIDVGLYSEGLTVPVVQADNARKVNAITAGLKALGIKDADLQTSNYSISPKYDYTNNTQHVVGYTVSQSLTVNVRDLAKVGDAIAKATELGANQINGVNFTIDDPTEQKQLARTKAIDDARKKAQELADAMGVKLVKVVTFSESSYPNPSPMPYAMVRMDSAGVSAVAPDIQAGSLDVTAHVSVTFEIR